MMEDEDPTVIANSHAIVERDDSGSPEPDMTDRELLLAIYDSQLATQRMVEGVIAEVGPMVESFANNPALKMLGFGKKFGL